MGRLIKILALLLLVSGITFAETRDDYNLRGGPVQKVIWEESVYEQRYDKFIEVERRPLAIISFNESGGK